MHHSAILCIFCGIFQFQAQVFAVSCPPSNSNGATTVEFCSDSEVTSSNIYVDSSDASSRVTNCTCQFKVTSDTDVVMKTTMNHTDGDCRSKIRYGHIYVPNPPVHCYNIAVTIVMKKEYTYNLTFINEESGTEPYCLHLFITKGTAVIKLSCFADSHQTTKVTTSTTPYLTTKGTISTTTFTTKRIEATSDTSDFTTSSKASQKPVSTAKITESENNQDLPLQILAPAIGGGVLLILVIIIIAVVCIRRKKKNSYEEPGPKTDLHGYENQAVVVNDDDDDEDEMRENELYHSRNISNDLQTTAVDIGGGYAEVESTVHGTEANRNTDNGLQNTAVDIGGGYAEVETPVKTEGSNNPTSNQVGQQIFSVPTNRPLTQHEGGPLYSMPMKKQKKNKEMENDGPVYAMPDKKNKKNQQKEDIGPLYAMVDKKNKKDNTKGGKQNANKKPPVISPKPVVNSSNRDKGSGTVNEDGLHYSELELHDSNSGPSNSNFNISDKTGYAEVL